MGGARRMGFEPGGKAQRCRRPQCRWIWPSGRALHAGWADKMNRCIPKPSAKGVLSFDSPDYF